jgi:tripartite-type tricarboxylate transporter receptor subunit TctC
MDTMARMLAQELEKILNVKVIPNNKPGASTVLATDAVARGKKDGYTLLYTSASSLVFVPITNPEVVKYDPFKDVEPLGLHWFSPTTITVRADSPWKTFPEFVEYARKNPGKLRVSTMGFASLPHFMLEMIQVMSGTQMTHVPFEGGESVTTAALGGHVEACCDGFSKVSPHVDAKKLRILLTNLKIPLAPEIPTTTELGYKQGLPTTWFAIYAPAGIPDEARKVLVPAVEKAVKNTKSNVDQQGNLCQYMSPPELREMQEEQYKQIYEIAGKIGLRKP